MDKYEYNVKLEQIKKLIRKKDYATAARIADTIDWYKVKNNQTIVLIADVYEASGRYEQARENLKLAYDRSGLGRQIAYKLVKVCIKCGKIDEAEDFYDDFVSAAPRDISKYLLQYELAKAKGEPLEKQISILEQYLEEDMDDRWAFELAKLYHKTGQRDKCIEQCDTVMLWFSDGKYVDKAMDLKMIYTPLTKSQQQRYEARWREKSAQNNIKIEEIKVKEVDVANKYNTQNIQNALKESMDQIFAKEEKAKDEAAELFKPLQKKEPEEPDDYSEADGAAEDAEETDSEATEDTSEDKTTDAEENAETTDGEDETSADNADKGEAPDGNGDGQGAPDGEAPSMLDLTGEEQEITVTDSTVITKQSMGGGQGAPGGEAPEKPDGDNGEAPEKPDGDNADDNADAKSEDTENTDDSEKADASDDSESSDAEKTEEASDSENADSEAPEKPEGEAPDGNGQAPDGQGAPDGAGQTEEITLDDIKEGDVVAITLDDDGNVATITVQSMGGGQGGPGSQASGVDSYDAANEYSEDETVSDTSLESTGTDENAALVSNGAEVTFSNDAISRTSSDSQGGDNSSFYGVGAAVLATDGTAYVKGSTVTTDSKGGAGLFAYGDGTVYAADTDITTQQDTSGGIHAAGGGKLYAWDLNVETNGESSAAIRSDRGGGTMVVDGGTYTSNGVGSPAVYCTADIAVNNAELTANGSEAVCIEGLNSLRLYNSNLTGNMSDDEQNDTTWTVILYQSMSGDSEVGNSTFQMDGGTITSKNGGLFYTTNTECTITLKDVDITYNDDNEFFLQCTGNNNQRGWGQSGANGSDCNFTADSQDMKGNVIWDSISDLDFYMTNGSTLEGAFVNDESNAGNGGDGYCNVVIDKDSTWTVTGDSTITSLSNAGTIADADGKTVSIVGTDGTTYVEGDSDYTITVGSYQDSADTSASTTVDDWSSYEVERPESL